MKKSKRWERKKGRRITKAKQEESPVFVIEEFNNNGWPC